MRESESTLAHKKHAPAILKAAVLTVSSTQTKQTNISGKLIAKHLENKNHIIKYYKIVSDNPEEIKKEITNIVSRDDIEVIITTGGTGISKTDITIEAIKQLFEKELTGFNPLFMQTSYGEVGSAVLLSRATAGIINNKVIFCLPGSPKACKLAMEKLILPEAGHIIKHLAD